MGAFTPVQTDEGTRSPASRLGTVQKGHGVVLLWLWLCHLWQRHAQRCTSPAHPLPAPSPPGCSFPGGPCPTPALIPSLSVQEEKKVPPPIPKKPPRSKVHPVKERSLDSVDRQRQEARKRLLAAKRAASFRQSSATESADSIEIYIPEAQTRL